jgi:hypothetical protein
MNSMITLADLRARNTLPSWQEAVAIVQELFHTTAAGRGSAAGLPDIEHIGLSTDGTIATLPGSPVPHDPVRHLAVIMDLLLEDVTAPPELVDIVQRNLTDQPEARSVEELAKALAFFERPGRRDDIAALVARALVAEEQTRADEELRRLKARALEGEMGRDVAGPVAAPGGRSALVPLVAAVALLALALSAGALWWQTQASSPEADAIAQAASAEGGEGEGSSATSPEASPDSRPTSLLGRVGDAVRSVFSASPSTPELVPTPPASPAPVVAAPHARRRAARASANAARNGLTVADDPETDPVTIITTELGGRALEPEGPPESAAARDSETVYTSGDLSVLPPTIVRPVIPPPPSANAPPESVALFDLVVDRQGRVEQVLLASSPARFHERMILSHIKAWTFHPAMKDGRPVRYRLRILLSV